MEKMIVECTLKRADGSLVTIEDRSYHFKPEQDNGPHVAMVDHAEDLACFLRVPESYRLVGVAPAVVTGLSGGEAPPKFDYSDLSGITEVKDLSDAWLHGFCREVLKVEPNDRAALEKVMRDGGLEPTSAKQPFTSMIREIVKATIDDDRKEKESGENQ
jgi:hypothetical protein